MKGNTNRKGRKASEEAKGKISANMKGNTNRKDKGKPVYLYIVRTNALELSATFHNRERASESLGINRTTLYRYITNRKNERGLSRGFLGRKSFFKLPPPFWPYLFIPMAK